MRNRAPRTHRPESCPADCQLPDVINSSAAKMCMWSRALTPARCGAAGVPRVDINTSINVEVCMWSSLSK